MKRTHTLTIVGVLAAAALVYAVFGTSERPADALSYRGLWIPFAQMRIVDPHPGCEEAHWHAKEGKHVTATDGTVFPDDTDCGFGPAEQ